MSSTAVRFLNGDLVSYDVPRSKLVDVICTSYPVPIHPLQVVLVTTTDPGDPINVLILPKKQVRISDYSNVLKTVSTESFLVAFSRLDVSSITNASILAHALTTIPLSLLPVHLWRNPHPSVVDTIESHFFSRGEHDIQGILARATGRNKCLVQLVCANVLSNPSDRVVERLVCSPSYTNASCSVWMCNPHPKMTELMYGEFQQSLNEKGADAELTRALMTEVIEHPGVTPDMVQRIVDVMPEHDVRILLVRNMNRTWLRERAPFVWTLLYQKWLTLSPEIKYWNVFIPPNHFTITNLLHTKNYKEIIQKFGNEPGVFDKLSCVSDSDEVAEWLLSSNNTIARMYYSDRLLRNSHPLVVEWALTDEKRWKSDEFATNPNPLAVAKTWLHSLQKPSLPQNSNEEFAWAVLYHLRCDSSSDVRVDLLDFLRLLQNTDADVVF